MPYDFFIAFSVKGKEKLDKWVLAGAFGWNPGYSGYSSSGFWRLFSGNLSWFYIHIIIGNQYF